jgi:hypothetical protein
MRKLFFFRFHCEVDSWNVNENENGRGVVELGNAGCSHQIHHPLSALTSTQNK